MASDEQNGAGLPSLRDHTVRKRLELISNTLANDHVTHQQLPGLHDLLKDHLKAPLSSEDFHRRLLRVFRNSEHDSAYERCLDTLTPNERDCIEKFVHHDQPLDDVAEEFEVVPSAPVRDHLQHHEGVGFAIVSSEGVRVVGANSDWEQVAGQPSNMGGCFHELLHKLRDLFTERRSEDPQVVVYTDTRFQNWGLDVAYVPRFTCIPNSVAGVQLIVKFAKAHNMSVRCAGFRHSWAPIFGRQGQITISMLGLGEVTRIPNFTALTKFLPKRFLHENELQTIEVVSNTDIQPRSPGSVLVRVGASTTNEQLRRWCVENNQYTYPLNVIMVEMTVGGTNAPICHGAGRRHQTLSDLVRMVEYVDCNGNVRVVRDPDHLRAAAGCFGLMGVVTHLTLEFRPMTYALMQPGKLPVLRAIPPPDDLPEDKIPPALRLNPPLTPEQREADLRRFRERAENWYYAEWFWFPYSDHCWVNCWNDTQDGDGAVDYPSASQTFAMFLSQFTVNVLQNSRVLNRLIDSPHLSAAAVTLLSKAAMLALPAWDAPVKMHLPNALHFQRGIQNLRVRDVEVELPVPARTRTTRTTTSQKTENGGSVPDAEPAGSESPCPPDGAQPDWEVVQRAWWDAILTCYEDHKTAPQRLPLEMRIMGDSDMVMAPQRGNTLGTCSIEVLTLEAVTQKEWFEYAEKVLARWLSYKDDRGNRLRARPHWAKQWDGIRVDDRPWGEKLKEDYEEERREFKQLLAAIGREHGWTLSDLKKRFSNDFFDDFFFDDVE